MIKNIPEAIHLIIKFLDNQVNFVKEKAFDEPLTSADTAFKFGYVHGLKTIKTECEKFVKDLETMSNDELKDVKEELGIPAMKDAKSKGKSIKK